MTKLRAPLSIDQALARIAGHLPEGYDDMAAVVEKSASTVRSWGDPDKPLQVPMADAILLDLAYREAGGTGAPLFECYAQRLDSAHVFKFADEAALGRIAADSIRECGEAHAALVEAAQPGADRRRKQSALREVDEAIAQLNRAKPILSGSASGCVPQDQTTSPETDHPATGPPDPG